MHRNVMHACDAICCRTCMPYASGNRKPVKTPFLRNCQFLSVPAADQNSQCKKRFFLRIQFWSGRVLELRLVPCGNFLWAQAKSFGSGSLPRGVQQTSLPSPQFCACGALFAPAPANGYRLGLLAGPNPLTHTHT